MWRFAGIVGGGQPPLAGRRVYLAGPRTSLDPQAYAQLEADLLNLGVIDASVADAFAAAAAALRAQGADVTCPFEAAWWRGDGSGAGANAVRAGREADARALEAADLVVVLDGWEDVPGAVDTAVIVAETRDVPWARVSAVLESCRQHQVSEPSPTGHLVARPEFRPAA
jgi:hypothetical protein